MQWFSYVQEKWALNIKLWPHSQVANDVNLVPWLTNYFYVYYPITILFVCVANLLRCGSKAASKCGYKNSLGQDDDFDGNEDTIKDGKALINRGSYLVDLKTQLS